MTLNLSLSQIETIIQSSFQDTVQLMTSEFDLDESAVRNFIKENIEKHITKSAKLHYNRYNNCSKI